MTDPACFWCRPGYMPYLQPALTDDALAAAEAELGVTLPLDFVSLLRQQNGGYIRGFMFDEEPILLRCISGIGPHFPSILNQRHDRVIEIGGDGHWAYCLDYREKTTEPSVIFVDYEQGFEEKLADNFAEFIGALELEKPPIAGIRSDAPIGDIIGLIEQATGIGFEDRGDYDHGYHYFYTRLSERPIVNLFVSSNRVPRVWAREGERGYEELPQTEERVARFPEVEDWRWIIDTSEDFWDRGRLIRFTEQLRDAAPALDVVLNEPDERWQ